MSDMERALESFKLATERRSWQELQAIRLRNQTGFNLAECRIRVEMKSPGNTGKGK